MYTCDRAIFSHAVINKMRKKQNMSQTIKLKEGDKVSQPPFPRT